jgi:hypothetical protein
VIVSEHEGSLVLVRQADHALLSGHLAAAWGAEPWDPVRPYEPVVLGARLHDLCWTPFDERVPLRQDGRPLAFTEVPRTQSTRFYGPGVDAAEAIDPYAGLLVSLHLTGFFQSHWGFVHPAQRMRVTEEERPAIGAFLDAEGARQRRLRERLGVGVGEGDRLLRSSYLLLQIWDLLSLDVCRRSFDFWEGTYPAVPSHSDDGAEVSLQVRLEPGGVCRLSPYPLRVEPLTSVVPAARVPLPAAGDEAALRRAWLSGMEPITVTFRAA